MIFENTYGSYGYGTSKKGGLNNPLWLPRKHGNGQILIIQKMAQQDNHGDFSLPS
jgi:hypothetical protein